MTSAVADQANLDVGIGIKGLPIIARKRLEEGIKKKKSDDEIFKNSQK